jgi:plastocyanin
MRAQSWAIAAALLAILVAASCGSRTDEQGGTPPESMAAAGAAGGEAATLPLPEPGSGGLIAGRALLAGTPPAAATINMDADPYCTSSHATAPASESLVVNADGSLRNVFVYLKRGLAAGVRYAAPSEPVLLDQVGCQYRPHVFGIQVGQPLTIRNTDGTLHNVHTLSRNTKAFNIGMPEQGREVTRRFDAEEIMVRIKCDVHPWMESWAGVLAHPFFAVSGDGGAFAIRDVPPGTYTLEAWHETLGTQVKTVTVAAGAPATLDFTFQASAASASSTRGVR